MIYSFLMALANGIFGVGEMYMKRKHLEAQAKMEMAKERVKAEIEWDIESAKTRKWTWTDEYLTILVTIPLIMVFIPGLDIYVEKGFKALATSVPDWYYQLVAVVFAATFGVKSLVSAIKKT